MKLNLGSGQYPLAGFWNVDAADAPRVVEWSRSGPVIVGIPMQEFLRALGDGEVDAITVSHSLMYVPAAELPSVLRHMHRVLKDGGVVRITEDETSIAENVWHDAVTLLTGGGTASMLQEAGFVAAEVDPTITNWGDDSLIQTLHGDPPRVFHVEGVK